MYLRHILRFTLLLGMVLVARIAFAQVSTSYDLSWWGTGSGGVRQSANYQIDDSLGQIAGVADSSSIRLVSGFSVGGYVNTTTDPPTSKSMLFLPMIEK
jgi:hypothetical protein